MCKKHSSCANFIRDPEGRRTHCVHWFECLGVMYAKPRRREMVDV